MQKNNPWLKEAKSTVTPTKHLLANLSIKVRTSQYEEFKRLLGPKPMSKILDVGVTSDDSLKDTNMFERLYPYLDNVTGVTIEDPEIIKNKFPKMRIIKIMPGEKLPFKDKQFDIVTSWATLEHVGGFGNQNFFMQELSRVGKRVFVTTPYRGCVYEPHSGLFFVHWLPLNIFRKICKITGRGFWSTADHLNPLFAKDVAKVWPEKRARAKVYKMFGFLPSHLLIYAK